VRVAIPLRLVGQYYYGWVETPTGLNISFSFFIEGLHPVDECDGNMKYLLFGGGGFIGSAVADRLLADRHSLRIFELPRVEPYRRFDSSESVEWITGDFQSVSDLRRAIDGVDAVLHLVSTTLPKGSNEDPVYDVNTNVISTIHMLNSMVQIRVKRIIFISSGGTVYGVPRAIPVTEDHPTDPEVSYGITKLMIEKYLYLYNRLHGLEPIILRVANPYGERQRTRSAQGAVAAFIHRALAGEPIEIWGDGSVARDYIYIADVARACALALQYRGEKMIFNVSSGVGTSLTDLVTAIETIIEKPLQVRYLPGRSFDVPISVLDYSLAKKELDWSPKVTLLDGLRRTISWASHEAQHRWRDGF
jgi:UDP-glucose 4-epimerase